MLDVAVIAESGAAVAALTPLRSRLLAELTAPASAAGLALRLGLPRQKINYHMRALESHGLIVVAEERAWGGITERLFVATAHSYVVSPGALGPVAVDPERSTDRLSASYLIALAARAVREVGALVHRAATAKRGLATMSVDVTIRFRTATERAAFARDLTTSVADLASRYHDESAPGGRAYRLIALAHPEPRHHPVKEQS